MSENKPYIDRRIEWIEEKEGQIESHQKWIEHSHKLIAEKYTEIGKVIKNDYVSTGDSLKDACLLQGRSWKQYFDKLSEFREKCKKYHGELVLVYWTEKVMSVHRILDHNDYYNETRISIGVLENTSILFQDGNISIPTASYIENITSNQNNCQMEVKQGTIHIHVIRSSLLIDEVGSDILFGYEAILDWWNEHILLDSHLLYEACRRLNVKPIITKRIEISITDAVSRMQHKLAELLESNKALSVAISSIPDTSWMNTINELKFEEIPVLSDYDYSPGKKEEICGILRNLILYGAHNPLLEALNRLYLKKWSK